MWPSHFSPRPSFLWVYNPAQAAATRLRTCYHFLVSNQFAEDLRPELRRRSQRVRARIAVEVRTQTRSIRLEKSNTLIVNAHGALILLAMEVETDQLVVVKNIQSGEELLSRVTSTGASFMGKSQVGIEFIKPSPNFWGLPSPPKNWNASGSNPRRHARPEPASKR